MTPAAIHEMPSPVWTPDGCLAAGPANDNKARPAKCAYCNGTGYLDYAGFCMDPGSCGGAVPVQDFPPVYPWVAGPAPGIRPPLSFAHLPPLIGITGKRDVGKSTVAGILEKLGYARVHAFDGGKMAARAYFEYVTGDRSIANRMVFGDLKDAPCASLPGGVAPRHFLELFGHFMGDTMGVDWTLGMEIERTRRLNAGRPIVAESLVYEAGWFRRQGGKVVRIVRPDHDSPTGVASDSVQADIIADEVICNDGSIADLQERVLEVLEGLR